MIDKQSLLKSFSDLLDNVSGGTQKGSPETVVVRKSVDEEKRQGLFVVLHAYADESEYDLHDETYNAEEVEKACHNYNRNCMRTNLGHLMMVGDETAYVVESYCSEVDMVIGDEFVAKGSWLQKWQFEDDVIWEGVKEQHWNGLSVQCMAEVEELDNG